MEHNNVDIQLISVVSLQTYVAFRDKSLSLFIKVLIISELSNNTVLCLLIIGPWCAIVIPVFPDFFLRGQVIFTS